jgi:glutamate synthase domain-containing protein 3
MARQCHLNTCPVGIATQDETLRTRFNGKPEMVIAYFRALVDEVRKKLAELGANSLTELKGAYDLLRPRDPNYAETPALALESNMAFRIAPQQVPGLHASLTEAQAPQTEFEPEIQISAIRNSDRSVGAGLSGEMARDRAAGRASHSAISKEFQGSAGQSFGAFLGSGISFKLDGEANDYVGKGLCGGAIAISAGTGASRRGDVLVGNTVLYGATSGQLFVAGRGGERFAIRNSGALAVVEGVGQHGCEYMTGGVALILGPVGLNFGSGMTGGLAYILRAEAEDVLHRDFVTTQEIIASEDIWLRRVLREHADRTGSPRAARLLSRRGPLPMWRVQPVHLQGTVESTWQPILAQLKPEVIAMQSVDSAAVAAHAVSI